MSFEPRVEGRSLEASYNLTAQLRLEMVERRREEEVSTKEETKNGCLGTWVRSAVAWDE